MAPLAISESEPWIDSGRQPEPSSHRLRYESSALSLFHIELSFNFEYYRERYFVVILTTFRPFVGYFLRTIRPSQVSLLPY